MCSWPLGPYSDLFFFRFLLLLLLSFTFVSLAPYFIQIKMERNPIKKYLNANGCNFFVEFFVSNKKKKRAGTAKKRDNLSY